MSSSVSTIRELTAEETILVGGAWTWQGLAGAMISGAVVGGLGGAVSGIGIPMGALSGALLGGTSYLINDFIVNC